MDLYKYRDKRGKLVYGHIQSIITEAPFVLVYRNQKSLLWHYICSSSDYASIEQKKYIAEERDGYSEVEIWATLKRNFGDGDYGES